MDNQIKEMIKSRKSDNNKILECLRQYFEKYPDIRFGQALINLNILKLDDNNKVIDPFYEEPSDTLKHINVEKLTINNYYFA